MVDGRARGPQVTIKRAGREGAWLVFAGTTSEVKADVIEAFGFEASDFANSSLHQVVQAAEDQALGKAPLTAVKALGGSIQQVETTAPSEAPAPAEEPAKDSGSEFLAELIEKATSRAELKRLWGEHQAKFSTELVAAWKAKGRSLPA